MGGFVFDNSKNPDTVPLLDGRSRMTLTITAVRSLARLEPGLLPDISAEEIRDRSKTNGFAKTLVCVQAAWFSLQVIARLGQGLAISLLELNTFAHALCALAIYYIWWDKPLDIDEPTVIYTDGERAALVCCGMLFNNYSSTRTALPLWTSSSPSGEREPVLDKRGNQLLGVVCITGSRIGDRHHIGLDSSAGSNQGKGDPPPANKPLPIDEASGHDANGPLSITTSSTLLPTPDAVTLDYYSSIEGVKLESFDGYGWSGRSAATAVDQLRSEHRRVFVELDRGFIHQYNLARAYHVQNPPFEFAVLTKRSSNWPFEVGYGWDTIVGYMGGIAITGLLYSGWH